MKKERNEEEQSDERKKISEKIGAPVSRGS
jgi:hypothetical protein